MYGMKKTNEQLQQRDPADWKISSTMVDKASLAIPQFGPMEADTCLGDEFDDDDVFFIPSKLDGPSSDLASRHHSSFNKIDWGVLSRVKVFDPLGEACEFQKLYSPRPRYTHGPCIINFLSNFACYAMLARLTQWIEANEAIDSCNARLIFLATGTPKQSAEFLSMFERSGDNFPGELYCDPSLEIYKAFNLKRGFFRTVVPPLTSGIAKFGAKNVKEGIKRRIIDRHLIGDLWQMGGVFVVQGNHDDPHFRPQLLLAHADSTTVSTPSVFQVMSAVGFDGNLVIRPDVCLSQFNEKVKLIEGSTRCPNPTTRKYSFGSRRSKRFGSQPLPKDHDDLKPRRHGSGSTVGPAAWARETFHISSLRAASSVTAPQTDLSMSLDLDSM